MCEFNTQKILLFLIVLLLLFDLRLSKLLVVRACNSNSQCHDDECCLQKPWTNHFFCAKRIREGKVCWSRPHNATDTWDKYRVICPCIHKHECIFKDPIFVLKPVLAASTCQLKAEDADKT